MNMKIFFYSIKHLHFTLLILENKYLFFGGEWGGVVFNADLIIDDPKVNSTQISRKKRKKKKSFHGYHHQEKC